ncbi:hypothetical protein KR059_009549 [Drosophila kikkawai]|nr:hypothetical protein KR059_009549 [Drosophila kikkawai]
MKLFCLVLVIYVVALTLFGVDGRGGGTTNGVEVRSGGFVVTSRWIFLFFPDNSFHQARRNALDEGLKADEPPPPPKQFRQRRQVPPGLPPPPDGLPPPPGGMPPPPQFII